MGRFSRTSYFASLAALYASLTLAMSTAVPAASTAESVPTEFHFARMIYTDGGGSRRNFFGGGWWQQDWNEAETHSVPISSGLTRIAVGEPVVVRLTDEELFQYPWLYATQTGYWDLDDAEVARLREYLLRGGFLMCDDFFGAEEFEVFAATMTRVFPDREMVQLHGDEAVLHVVFSIDEGVQIRAGAIQSGQVAYLPPPVWLGIYDDDGRLMVGVNYNQDVGDSWRSPTLPDTPSR